MEIKHCTGVKAETVPPEGSEYVFLFFLTQLVHTHKSCAMDEQEGIITSPTKQSSLLC